MQDIRIESGSKQRVWMRVNTSVTDLSGIPVSMAVMPLGQDPEVGNFKTAAWKADLPFKAAEVMVGPGSDVGALAEGVYKMFTKVTATPEEPWMKSTNCLRIT